MASGELDISLEGYTAIGVVGWYPNFNGCYPEALRVYDNVLEYRFRNTASRNVNDGNPFPRVLYLKL